MKIRTLLIDGSYLLKRSVYGAKDSYTLKFGHIGGLFGFMTTMRKLVKDHSINKIVICWDGINGGVFRHHLDPAYKANRKNKSWHGSIELSAAEIKKEEEKEQSILKQRTRIKAYCDELFIRQIEVDEIEADDLIADYCIRNSGKEEIILYTNDRDFAQLLDYNITILFGNIDKPITKTNYFFHFKHHYSNALVFKILCGDPADNIKGISGLGENVLLKHFPEMKFKHISVREVCQKAVEINNERIKNKQKPLKVFTNLLENVERLRINHALTNLKNPILNDKAREELEILEVPLSPEGRGSKALMAMMMEDEFLSIYGSTFVNYVEPFYTVIMNEKQLLNEYLKNNKLTL